MTSCIFFLLVFFFPFLPFSFLPSSFYIRPENSSSSSSSVPRIKSGIKMLSVEKVAKAGTARVEEAVVGIIGSVHIDICRRQ